MLFDCLQETIDVRPCFAAWKELNTNSFAAFQMYVGHFEHASKALWTRRSLCESSALVASSPRSEPPNSKGIPRPRNLIQKPWQTTQCRADPVWLSDSAEQQNGWVSHQGPTNGHTLLLPSRQTCTTRTYLRLPTLSLSSHVLSHVLSHVSSVSIPAL